MTELFLFPTKAAAEEIVRQTAKTPTTLYK